MFFFSCFTTSVTPSINTPKSSTDFTALIISLISSYEINKVNTFPAVAASFPLVLLSNLFIEFETAFEVILLTNASNLSPANGIARAVTTFFILIYLIRTKKST